MCFLEKSISRVYLCKYDTEWTLPYIGRKYICSYYYCIMDVSVLDLTLLENVSYNRLSVYLYYKYDVVFEL